MTANLVSLLFIVLLAAVDDDADALALVVDTNETVVFFLCLSRLRDSNMMRMERAEKTNMSKKGRMASMTK